MVQNKVLGAVVGLAAGVTMSTGASAQVTAFSVTRSLQYRQETSSAPVFVRTAGFATLDFAALGQITSATVTPPGAAALSLTDPGLGLSLLSFSANYPTETALNAALPPGAYQVSYGGGTLAPGSFTSDVQFPGYAPGVPMLTAAAFQNLQSIFPGLQGVPLIMSDTSGGRLRASLINPANNFVHGFTTLGASGATSGVVIPTTPLLPNTVYEISLLLTNNTNVSVTTTPARSETYGSQIEVRIPFTTVPGPGAGAGLAMPGVLTARRRRR
jgi:hypothetical protein